MRLSDLITAEIIKMLDDSDVNTAEIQLTMYFLRDLLPNTDIL